MDPDTRLGGHERYVWIGILPLLLYLTLTGAGATRGVFVVQFRVLSLAILVVLLAAWAVAAWTRPAARPATTLGLPIALALAALAAATVFSSDPRASAEFLAYGVILAALYLLLVVLMGRPALSRRIVLVTAGAAVALSIGYVVAVFASWVEWWRLVGRLAAPPLRPGYIGLTYEAPGILTAFLVTAGAGSISFLIAGGRRDRVAALAVAACVGVAIVLTGTRGGWLGVGAATIVTATVALVTGGQLRLPRSGRSRAAVGGAIVAFGALVVAVGPAIADRLIHGGGEEFRLTLVANAVRDFQDHPLLGSGPGTWASLRTSYTQAGELDYYIPHAHNVLFQTLAETGIVGLVAGVVLVVAVLRVLVVPAIRSHDRALRSIGLGALFVGGYLLVHQMVDFFMDDPAILFAACLPIAALDAAAVRDRRLAEPQAKRSPTLLARWGHLIGIAAALIAVALIVRIELPALSGAQAAQDLTLGDDRAALANIDDALAGDPGQPAYVWIEGLAAAGLGDRAQALRDLRAVAVHDDLPQAWLNAAALELADGDDSAARADLERALRLGVQQPAVALPATQLWLHLNEREKATSSAIAALSVAPALTDDPWWTTTPELRSVRDAAVESIVEHGDPGQAWQVAMYAGQPAAARSIASALPTGAGQTADLVIDAWDGVPGARDALDAAAEADPTGGAAIWAARVAERDGDLDAAEHYRRMAELSADVAGSDTGYDTVVTDDITSMRQVPGPYANVHFFHVYRRWALADMLVPGLPKLTLE
jgi:O-antigen ligase/tetratricopeptide (TPR) repeat protein